MVVETSRSGPLDVVEQVAIHQRIASVPLQHVIGSPVVLGIGIDRVDVTPSSITSKLENSSFLKSHFESRKEVCMTII